MAKSKIRWGDTLDDEEALPPASVKGPDSHGVKVTTEYYKNDKGEAIKKVTKVKVVQVEKKVYKVRRRDRLPPCSGGCRVAWVACHEAFAVYMCIFGMSACWGCGRALRPHAAAAAGTHTRQCGSSSSSGCHAAGVTLALPPPPTTPC